MPNGVERKSFPKGKVLEVEVTDEEQTLFHLESDDLLVIFYHGVHVGDTSGPVAVHVGMYNEEGTWRQRRGQVIWRCAARVTQNP